MQRTNPYDEELKRLLTEPKLVEGKEVKVQVKELDEIDPTRAFDAVSPVDREADIDILRKKAFEAFPKEFKGSHHVEFNPKNIETIKNILDEVIHEHLESPYIKSELAKIQNIKARDRMRADLGRSIINNILGAALSPEQLARDRKADTKQSSKKFSLGLKSEEKIQKKEKEKNENINAIFHLFSDVARFFDQDPAEIVDSAESLQRGYLADFMRNQLQIQRTEDKTSIVKESIDEAVKDKKPRPYLAYGLDVLLDREKMAGFRNPHVNRFIGYYGIESYYQVLAETLVELLKILNEHKDIENMNKFKKICEEKLPEQLYKKTIEQYNVYLESTQKFRLLALDKSFWDENKVEKKRDASEKMRGDSQERNKEKQENDSESKQVRIKRGRDYMRPSFEKAEKHQEPEATRARAATTGQLFDRYHPKREKDTIEGSSKKKDVEGLAEGEKYAEPKKNKIERPGGRGK